MMNQLTVFELLVLTEGPVSCFSRHDAGRSEHQPEEEVGVCPLQRLGADLAAEGQSGGQLQDHHDRQ